MGSISLEFPQGSLVTPTADSGEHGSPVSVAEPIAIIGMAMRLPGRVRTSEDFWQLMVEKRSGLCDTPKDRFNIAGFHHPSGMPGTLHQKQAYYLQDIEIQDYDVAAFPLNKKELERLDPNQRQLLQVAYECMEDAGVTSWRGSNLGCFIGTNSEDWNDLNAKETQHRGNFRGTGQGDYIMANRLSYHFNLRGPSVAVKTACSSSLVGLDLACQSIRNFECDGALVGGASLMFSPTAWQGLQDQGLLSPTGTCKTFDADADGYARGEAINMIYIKRLKDAVLDGNHIRAVIRSTAVNSNGRDRGRAMPVPDRDAQAALIRQAYGLAGISDISETAMVECHGTGTAVGDPIETAAVASCFGDKGVIITGVKPNVGHGEGASGITSVIKAVLALEYNQIPPNILFDKPNPNSKFAFDQHKLRVPIETEEWPQGRARRISVNSFGVGGVNAHVILEAPSEHGIATKVKKTKFITFDGTSNGTSNGTSDGASDGASDGTPNGALTDGVNKSVPRDLSSDALDFSKEHVNVDSPPANNVGFVHPGDTHATSNGSIEHVNGNDATSNEAPPTQCSTKPSLLLFSAFSSAAVESHFNICKDTWGSQSENVPSLSDLAYTLSSRREQKPYRAFAVTDNASTVEISSTHLASEVAPHVVWVFTGQGAQWPGMGVDLLEHNTTFRAAICRLDELLSTLPEPPNWTIEVNAGELRKSNETSRVHGAEFGHPLSVAVQIALVDVLTSWGLKPNAVLGHSSGEMAAAYASGAIDAKGALAAAVLRGKSNMTLTKPGSMAAVGLARAAVEPYLIPGVVIACENSHLNVTLSGDAEGVKQVMDAMQKKHPDVLVRALRVEKAYHSPHMGECGPDYETQLQPLVSSVDPPIPFYSTVTGKRVSGEQTLEAAYWRQNMESPVHFNTALRECLEKANENTVLVEIGPHPALAGPIGQILRDLDRTESVLYISTLVRAKGRPTSLLSTAGKLFQHNAPLDYSVICPPGEFVREIPRYSWQQETCHWFEPRIVRDWRFREHAPHELIGVRVLDGLPSEPCWRSILLLNDLPWLAGHEVDGHVIMPGTGFVSMVGAALKQLEGHDTYSLRNVQILAARILEFDKQVEVLTSLKPLMIDAQEKSPWYSFNIHSFDGARWSHNVTGEARACMDESSTLGLELDPVTISSTSFPRKVDADRWYRAMAQNDINHTGMFQGMSSVSAATNTREAMATVSRPLADDKLDGDYTVHPALLDQCVQLFAVAVAQGVDRKLTESRVPVFIGEMVVAPSTTSELRVHATYNETTSSQPSGRLVARSTDNGLPVVFIKDLRTTDLARAADHAKGSELPLISTLQWMPHSDLADPGSFLQPEKSAAKEVHMSEEVAILCAIGNLEQMQLTDATPPHLHSQYAWLRTFVDSYHAGENQLVPTGINLENLTREERTARIESLVAELATTPYAAVATGMYRLFTNTEDVFAGKAHPLEILHEDDLLFKLYDINNRVNIAPMLRTIGNTNPRMRILEVGAGTGATTATILKGLHTSRGGGGGGGGSERLYGSYMFTDVSAGFLTAARERFSQYDGMDYGVLDLTRDPLEQGFEKGSFDLIIASNVVHATPSLSASLSHIHTLLSGGGRILLGELCPESKAINYIMGFLPGWWLGTEDGRPTEPYVSPERWAKELVTAGFLAPEVLVPDCEAPYQIGVTILASRESRMTKSAQVSLLCHTPESPCVAEMRCALEALDTAVDVCMFGDDLPATGDVISLVDLEEPFVHGMNENSFKTLVSYMKQRAGKLLWLTQASQVDCEDPRAAMILGFARTARYDTGVPLYTVEMDKLTPLHAATKAVTQILMRINTRGVDFEHADPEYEFAVSGGQILIPRLHWDTISGAFQYGGKEDTITKVCQKSLRVPSTGRLQSMCWEEAEIVSPGEGEILVETRAAGLNFKDLLISLGILLNERPMGLEGSGVVTEVGRGVQDFVVGDRVLYFGSGCFSTHMKLPEMLCVKLDDTISFEMGAALPAVYTTAYVAITELSNLQPGQSAMFDLLICFNLTHLQSILVQSACGGVGLAAIQLAQMIGAEVSSHSLHASKTPQYTQIYCTVSSKTKADYLVQHYGIERARILQSRDVSFLHDLMRLTDNRGVDVVLNSLSGELLRASWLCLAECGTMVEIGKRDFQRRAKLTMEPFEQNRRFVGFDLARLTEIRPERVISIHPAANIQDAFRTMQGAQHIGKIVVQMPEDASNLESVAPRPIPGFKPDRSYLIVGGLGGLGRVVASWMVENGARNLVFLSRSAREGTDTHDFLDELRSQDCQVQLVAGSVANMADVQQATSKASQPLAGIIQMSMALRDVSLHDMTSEDWTTTVETKVQGTWNLHEATSGLNLDFFIMTSSFTGLLGNYGQANYAAAGSFLDAFAQYRNRLGLPASVIDMGVMSDAGYVARNAELLNHLARAGPRPTKLAEFLDAVHLAVLRSFSGPTARTNSSSARGSYSGVASAEGDGSGDGILIDNTWEFPAHFVQGLVTTKPFAAVGNHFAWKRETRMGLYHNISQAGQGAAGGGRSSKPSLKALVAAAGEDEPPEETSRKITMALAEYIANLTIKEVGDIPLEKPLESLGMDSLVAIELKSWVSHEAGIELSIITITQCPSLMAMGEEIRQAMVANAAG
ncbi:polyketide synthase [Apiospora saccharicola]|uniref:Polyketide synthase n=1 Tax=Apiospora saccharicola TaxID=335842 RepID=A0ABR1TJX6_9PEZI